MKLYLSKQKREDMILHDKIIAHKYYSIRETCRFSKNYQDNWIKEMIDLIPNPPKKILDYCCGTSILYPLIKNRFNCVKYYGIDTSKEMLNIGRKKFGQNHDFKTFQQDGENLRFKDFFDVVIAKGAIHHLPKPSSGLKSISNALHKEGVLVISEPTSNFIVKLFRKILYKFLPHFSSSHKSFTLSELKKLLNNNGFKIIQIKHFGLFAFPFGFPDIIPFFKYFPYRFLRLLEQIDNILLKVPIIKTFSWSTILVAQRK